MTNTIKRFKVAIGLDPNDALAWLLKGFEHANLERHSEALDCFERAIELNPDDAGAWHSKGVELGALKRYSEALDCFERAIELNPNHANAWLLKGVTLGNLERHPEGRDIDLITYGDSPLDLGAVLTEVLSKLVYAENVASNDIVILSEGGPAKPPLTGSRKPGVFNLVSTRTGIPNDIFTTTIRLFKGLESPVIILICPSTDIARLDELMYVGISRARNHLILLLDDQNRDSILPRLT